jgi:hypothetical protein
MALLQHSIEPFPGSYAPDQVSFLLRRIALETTALAERERVIADGGHYSEMIGPEDRPGRLRMRLFRQCLESNAARFSRDLAALAEGLIASVPAPPLVLTSIARAGTPVGVLLRARILARTGWAAHEVPHYSISVIRDRGVDAAAVRWIAERHPADRIRFIDGWTGKGTIARELRATLSEAGTDADPGLWVPLDVCGVAAFAASSEDYLIPTTLLGGTISGLVSRSVLPRHDVGRECWHGCVELGHLRRYDLSRWLVERLTPSLVSEPAHPSWPVNRSGGADRFRETEATLDRLSHESGITDRNRIKLGIGETVRVLLRRQPRNVLLRPSASADHAMIRALAAERNVPVETRDDLPFESVAFIGSR